MKFFRYLGLSDEHIVNAFSLVFLCVGKIVTLANAGSREKINVQGTLDTIDYTAMNIEANYTGPKLEDVKVTFKFMKNLVGFYKNSIEPSPILHQKYAFMILKQVRDHFKKQPSLIEIKLPIKENITVCGDIHGNLHDVLHIFDLHGFPSEKNRYLFNGDFVNRGWRSVECALIYFGYKLLYPDSFFINRGNHEDMLKNQGQGGLAERIEERYPGNTKLLHGFWEVFQWLPLAYVISSSDVALKSGDQTDRVGYYNPIHGKVLVVHGELFSKRGVTLEDIRQIKRGCDADDAGENSLMFDILWSDPTDKNGRHNNSLREKSIRFGPNVSESFCNRNKIDYIIRSHTTPKEGYHVEHNGRLLTIFSATNYNNGNKGAVALLEAPDLKPKITTYKHEYEFGPDEKLLIDKWEDEKNIPIGKYNTTGIRPFASGFIG